MNDAARTALVDVIARFGRTICDDPRRAEALLYDLCGPHRREISVLVSALRERVPLELLGLQPGVVPAIAISRLTQRLENDLGLAPDPAQWAVESWALALGVIGKRDLSAPRAPAAAPPAQTAAPRAAATSKAVPAAPDRLMQVATLAGTGRKGFADGPGDRAQFKEPHGIVAAPDGTLYVADTGNHRLRTIGRDGVTATLGRAGKLFGASDGALDAAGFYDPVGVALDARGALYVAERAGAIRIVRREENKVLSVSGLKLGTLAGLAAAADGTLYASETNSVHCILKVRLGSAIERIGGGTWPTSDAGDFRDGPAAQARFCGPAGLALDTSGNLYIADSANDLIRRCDPAGRVTTIAGSRSGFADGKVGDARFNRPRGVAVDASGCIYVADSGNHRIRRIARDGTVSTVAGTGKKGYADGAALQARFDTPSALCIAADGTLFVVDEGNHCIRAVTA